MTVIEEKKIIIRLPRFNWKSFANLRFGAALFALLCSCGAAYWYQAIYPYLFLSGGTASVFSSQMICEKTGKIVEMVPQEGDRVQKGQTLFILDPDCIFDQQRQKKEQMEAAQEQILFEKDRLGKAMENYLAASNEGSADKIQHYLAVLEEAQSNGEKLAAELLVLEKELAAISSQAKTLAYPAPYEGIILKRNQEPGALVQKGELLYTLCDPSRLWIEIKVPEEEIQQVKIGTPAKVTFRADSQQKSMGQISWIAPLAEDGAVRVKITLDHPVPLVKPGFTAQVTLKVRHAITR